MPALTNPIAASQDPAPRLAPPRYGVCVEHRVHNPPNPTSSRLNFPGMPVASPIALRPLHEIAAEEASEIVLDSLRHAGLSPDRRTVTSDGSVLFEFLSPRVAGVDIYPNGEAIVVVRDGATDHIHELVVSDTEHIVALLKDGRR
jgi:hypothetical protein